MSMKGWAGQRIWHPSVVFGTLLLQAGTRVGAPCSRASAPDLCGLPARGTGLLPACTPCLACSGRGPLTWSSEKTTIQPAKTPSPINPGHSKIQFYPWNKTPNSSQAKAHPQRHRICFSANGEGEIVAISLGPCYPAKTCSAHH